MRWFGFCRHSRESGNPVTSGVLARKALDSRLRGNDGKSIRANPESRIPNPESRIRAYSAYRASSSASCSR
ncbi:hypothetical protein [Lysobacter gummosus]|uniref:hypothetical protein n=1 Tax=Lysobacter gummosus TaxID=262324 RepID=UPI00363A066B